MILQRDLVKDNLQKIFGEELGGGQGDPDPLVLKAGLPAYQDEKDEWSYKSVFILLQLYTVSSDLKNSDQKIGQNYEL